MRFEMNREWSKFSKVIAFVAAAIFGVGVSWGTWQAAHKSYETSVTELKHRATKCEESRITFAIVQAQFMKDVERLNEKLDDASVDRSIMNGKLDTLIKGVHKEDSESTP